MVEEKTAWGSRVHECSDGGLVYTKVDTAEDGLEAVHAAQANPLKYDIIFMDNFMPVMVPHPPI